MLPDMPAARDRVAIVIPTLDESRTLDGTLRAAFLESSEVVISDGGSRDDTVAKATALGARVVSGPPGRGGQLNRGAGATEREVLLFLHADTRLPERAAARLVERIDGGLEGGAFLIRFDAAGLLYRFGERVVNARTRRFGWALGDQAHFVRRDVFEAMGGYRDWPILEDVDFIRRLGRRRRLGIVEAAVVTDARRFETRGKLRTVAVNWLIWALFAAGASPHRLARLYRHVR